MKFKILALVLLQLLSLCACGKPSPSPGLAEITAEERNEDFPEIVVTEPEPLETPEVTEPEPEPEPEPPEPSHAKISIVGDVLIHNTLIKRAYKADTDSYDFSENFQYVSQYTSDSDMMICQLEGTLAGSDYAYSGYPSFNTPEDILKNLKDAGFTLVGLAGNHALDFSWNGLVSTAGFIDEAGLGRVGTYVSQEERDKTNGVYIQELNGIKVAVIAYSYGTNGIPVPYGKEWALNLLYTDYLTNFVELDEEKIVSDIEAAKSYEPDVIIALIHWGNEYQLKQNEHQERAAKLFLENGVDIIFGGHPHVLEPMEKRAVTTVDGEEKEAFVSFSLGNFVSGQYYDYTNLSAILSVELEKDNVTGETAIKDVSYIPTYCTNSYQGETDGYYVLSVYDAIAGYEAGEPGVVDEALYQNLKRGLEDIHSVLGTEYDYFYKNEELNQ